MQIDTFDTIDSTNEHARAHAFSYYCDVFILARRQLHGKGRGNNLWQSEAGKNLTFSVLAHVESVDLIDAFVYSKAISVTIIQFLQNAGVKAKIKWPNDILVDGEKICGILIENVVEGSEFSKTILGVGLNVNQTQFDIDGAQPTSLALILGKEFNIDDCVNSISPLIEENLEHVKYGRYDYIHDLYMNNLLSFGNQIDVQVNNRIMKAKIQDVGNDGKLSVKFEDNTVAQYYMDEIKIM